MFEHLRVHHNHVSFRGPTWNSIRKVLLNSFMYRNFPFIETESYYYLRKRKVSFWVRSVYFGYHFWLLEWQNVCKKIWKFIDAQLKKFLYLILNSPNHSSICKKLSAVTKLCRIFHMWHSSGALVGILPVIWVRAQRTRFPSISSLNNLENLDLSAEK